MRSRFFILFLTSLFCLTSLYADEELDIIIDMGDYLASIKNFDEAIEKYKEALRQCESRETVIVLKIKIADCAFSDQEYLTSSRYYKSILKQYEYFPQKDYVVYKLCLALKHCVDWVWERDATKMNDLINWIKYYKKNCNNSEYLEELMPLYNEGMEILEQKDFENIKFYFDYDIFDSAIFCCEWFLKKYKNSAYRSEACWYKIKSTYLKNKSSFHKIEKQKNKYGYQEHILKMITEMREILSFIHSCQEDTKIYIEDIEDLYTSCFELLCSLSKFLKNEK